MIVKFIQYTNINNSYFLMRLVLLFVIYAILGWVLEVTCTIIEEHKIVNRGFLIGPYCPIHAFGSFACILILTYFNSNPFIVFILGALIATITEYTSIYIMEKIFHARWWDYSNSKYNFQGRIKLTYCLMFGVGAVVLLYTINPLLITLINNLHPFMIESIFIIATFLFTLDCIISIIIIRKVSLDSKKVEDNTEEIRNKALIILKNKLY